MEVLVIVCMLAIVGLSIAQSSQIALRMRGMAIHDSVAMQLAMEQLESFAAVDPATLDPEDSSSEEITVNGITFKRAVTVEVNTDTSRTLTVAIKGTNLTLGGEATVSDTYALWGSQ